MSNYVSDRIEKAKINAMYVAKNYAKKGHEDEVEKTTFAKEFEYLISEDLMTKNPDTLLKIYAEYFDKKEMPTKIIERDALFYRGRIGYTTVLGSDDDLSRSFIIPYYGNNISNPPPIHAAGGRFNREGTSYLYLADNVETCLAEVHLQIGQACSVAEFICIEENELIDLTRFEDDIEMQSWLNILTQPIHSGISFKYNETRFLADVFKTINDKGIYFSSVQAKGNNIVCFNPSNFEIKNFSEKIYTAKKIRYDFEEMTDAIKEFSKKKEHKYINSYNQSREDELEESFDYLERWIDYKRGN